MTNELTHDELVAGGNDQIPHLVDSDHDITVYGSDDIVNHLEQHYE